MLVVILYAEDADSAAEIAHSILERLPYELVEDRACVQRTEDVRIDARDPKGQAIRKEYDRVIEQGRQLGLGLLLHSLPTGDDEEAFAKMEF